MPRVRPATAVCLAALAVSAVGCKDDGAAPKDKGSHKPSEGSTSSPDSSGKPEGSGKPDSSAKPGGQDVDADLGRTLKLGESTTVDYKRAGNRTGTLRLTARSVQKGSQQDLGEAELETEQRSMQPYYVTVRYENVGDTTISAYDTPTGLRDSRGEEADPVVTVAGEVSECPKVEEYELVAGATHTNCKVFLLPKGESPSVVKYTGDFDKEPVYWKARK
ncbi:hypothetical protein [Streptomyces oceani]|uniref:DUF4352 domain-containing protein n=1 Tax=Streptomyces oceani TaxID=1075402 RepID=A0A1E7JW71_9ACTN|nr:hypothetical protein [Streptomyces oceani]OEU95764.1 hypothetical protein AN216_23295 [Streptomyces oceani]